MNLADLKLPLSVTGVVIVSVLSAFLFLDERHVHASDFRSYQQSLEVRALEKDKRAVEREILKTEVKCLHTPAQCTAVDKALLKQNKDYLKEINADLREAKAK